MEEILPFLDHPGDWKLRVEALKLLQGLSSTAENQALFLAHNAIAPIARKLGDRIEISKVFGLLGQ